MENYWHTLKLKVLCGLAFHLWMSMELQHILVSNMAGRDVLQPALVARGTGAKSGIVKLHVLILRGEDKDPTQIHRQGQGLPHPV